MVKTVVVFDFDRTLIDCDSDRWVVTELGVRDLFNQLRRSMQWNNLMDRMMKELHSKGTTIEEIAECLKRIPLHSQIISAIKTAHALGCDLKIISDANLFFIETILKHHGLMDYFSEIITNPSFVDEQGRLRISPYHDFISSSHGCERCSLNMCKGLVIERIRASAFVEEGTRFIYLGDGSGDYCPSLKLNENDYVMPRKNYPIWELICKQPLLMKAEIHEWNNGEDLARILLHLIHTISSDANNNDDSASLLSGDCKSQSVPISSSDSSPRTLPVPR